jgi:poly(3-hydroxyalkanoate) depolymerase
VSGADLFAPSSLELRSVQLGRQRLRVGIRRAGRTGSPPLLVFNGIGASIEMAAPFLDALVGRDALIFDVPGVGGSPPRRLPYRLWMLARLGARLLDHLGYEAVDVLGVSWGGALAQQFAWQYPRRVRRLVLAATSPGHLMVPGKLSALTKMASPARYTSKDFLRRNAAHLYGGAFRSNPQLADRCFRHARWPTRRGYFMQLLSGIGWSSLPFLHRIRQPTLLLAGNDDPIVPLANAHLLRRLLPDARLHVFDDGHLFLLTRPEECGPIVERFLDE